MLLPPCVHNPVPPSLLAKIFACLATHYNLSVWQICPHLKNVTLCQYGKVWQLNSGDTINTSSLVPVGDDHHDMTYVWASEITQKSHIIYQLLGEVGHCCTWHVWVHSSLTDCLYNNIKLVFPQGHQFWAVFGIPTETLVFLCLVLPQFDPMFFNKDWIKKSPNCEIICWDTSYHKLGGYTLMWNDWIIISYAMEQSWLWSENLNQSDKPLQHSMRNTDPILLH